MDKLFNNNLESQDEIKFAANLLLEIFDEVDTYLVKENMELVIKEKRDYVCWEILPPREDIWEKSALNKAKHIAKSKKNYLRIALNL